MTRVDLPLLELPKAAPFLERLECLFGAIDEAYTAAAAGSGFACRGCADNCCETAFYHHTLLEYLNIGRGLAALTPARREAFGRSARRVAASQAVPGSAAPRVMCPLNTAGRCSLYAHRPMICRLHGIPSRFRHPARGWVESPGCADFDRQCHGTGPEPLDRTPFYRSLAELEQSLRTAVGCRDKLRMTVAEMVAAHLAGPASAGIDPTGVFKP